MTPKRIAELEAELAAAKERIAELLEAAQPFVKLVEWYDQSVKDELVIYDYDSASVLFTVGQVRRLAEVAGKEP